MVAGYRRWKCALTASNFSVQHHSRMPQLLLPLLQQVLHSRAAERTQQYLTAACSTYWTVSVLLLHHLPVHPCSSHMC